MKKDTIFKIIGGVVLAFSLTACTKDLDQSPIDPDSFTEQNVFASATEAKGALAKIYAAYALTGQQGPAGQPDISGVDEGSTQFTRMLYYLQELPTDNAVLGWSDAGVPDFHAMNWSDSNTFIEGIYNRLGQQVSFANSFITNAQALASDTEVQYYIAEARFLRAYSYYYLLDLFANVPIVTEVSSTLPSQSSREEVFAFVESELKAIESLLKPAKSNEYGRVDAAAAQALLSRLYLNAEVYTGTNRYADCITYSEKVIASGYALHSDYGQLFLADNNTNGAQNEFIFTVNFDGIESKTYGGTTFLVHSAVGGSMNPADFGIDGGWGGMRTTKELVGKFTASATNSNSEPTAWSDSRALFYTSGQSYEISDITVFTDGYAVTKFKNITSAGTKGNDPANVFVDADLPLIRLAEVYLNYAEAVARGGGGSSATALQYVNALRSRAGASIVASGSLTIDFILDERARELYWEGFRRTDLVRYGLFTTGTYLWTYKGGNITGTSVSDFRNIYPIPANVLSANKNLKQNTGY